MGKFKSELSIRFKKGSEKIYILEEPLVYESVSFGKIVVPKGFQTDFASVPRVPIVYSIFGNRAHREAVLHDYAFRIDSKPSFTFMKANGLFLDAMKARNKPFCLRYIMYWSVVAASKPCYHKKKVMDSL